MLRVAYKYDNFCEHSDKMLCTASAHYLNYSKSQQVTLKMMCSDNFFECLLCKAQSDGGIQKNKLRSLCVNF